MIAPGPSRRYFLYREPADMRKSFDGLCGLVRTGLKKDPMSGDVFVFIHRRRSHMQCLYGDKDGFTLFYKRLEVGTFEVPRGSTPSWTEMVMLLDGMALSSVRYRRRYRPA